MNFEKWFSSIHPEIPFSSASAVLKLVEDKSTVPFIARYRKEQTGNLDEVAVQRVIDGRERWDEITKRQEFIVGEIERQGKLTAELREKILGTFDLTTLEDLYLPYKQKRKTKATIAREAGLEPFAEIIWNLGHGMAAPGPSATLESLARGFLNEERGIRDVAAAIQGAQDIITERLSETLELRQHARQTVFEGGCVRTGKAEKAQPHSKYERYFDYFESIPSLMKPQNSHRYLALRRGWLEEELSLNLGGAPDDLAYEDRLLAPFVTAACSEPDSPGAELLHKAARLALRVYVLPSIDTEVHKALKEAADEAAIKVFADNLSKLLLAAPFGSRAVLGVDPGLRTGCKLAVVDDSGKFMASTVIYLQSKSDQEQSKKILEETVKAGKIRAVAVGNGTAGRETEAFIREFFREKQLELPVVMVNESGASIYSASEVAREEFPDLDLTVRGAISIARRLQDPLAELVKVDPKSIGVGQYQHDVSQNLLKKNLEQVVDSCVNGVGVNINTASYHLLSRVSGIGPTLAKRIVEHRSAKGLFKSRAELLEIPRFSQKTFEQAAGFLRIPDGINPLDNTAVHPERYPALESCALKMNKNVADLLGSGVELVRSSAELRKEVGELTFQDIVRELSKPGRDPREGFVAVAFREDVHELKDLSPGMMCPGVVTNVTNFGAFVDIGVHQDGLIHISQLSDRYIKDPREVVSPGDRVTAKVIDINLDKRQIALSLKSDAVVSRDNTRQERQPAKDHPQKRSRADRGHAGKPNAGGFNNPFAQLGERKK
jgi:uncharacterized protein